MPTAPDFTIADVLAWARTKPADERYEFIDAAECALGQFLQESHGLSRADCYAEDVYFAKGWHADRPIRAALQDGKTFGGLVERLEKLCPAAPVPASEWTAIDAYLTDLETVEAQVTPFNRIAETDFTSAHNLAETLRYEAEIAEPISNGLFDAAHEAADLIERFADRINHLQNICDGRGETIAELRVGLAELNAMTAEGVRE